MSDYAFPFNCCRKSLDVHPKYSKDSDNMNCVKAVSKKSINLLMHKTMRDARVKWIKLGTQKPVD